MYKHNSDSSLQLKRVSMPEWFIGLKMIRCQTKWVKEQPLTKQTTTKILSKLKEIKLKKTISKYDYKKQTRETLKPLHGSIERCSVVLKTCLGLKSTFWLSRPCLSLQHWGLQIQGRLIANYGFALLLSPIPAPLHWHESLHTPHTT